jgi:hypothetical protein
LHTSFQAASVADIQGVHSRIAGIFVNRKTGLSQGAFYLILEDRVSAPYVDYAFLSLAAMDSHDCLGTSCDTDPDGFIKEFAGYM